MLLIGSMWSLLRWGMAACLLGASVAPARAEQLTTAWRDGQFSVETANVVRRSNIVLGRPNRDATQSMPLGNGTLGVAAWAADGFTAQLNRGDTFPGRKTPGRVVIPGLAQLSSAPDFEAHLDLYDAVLTETGGGMTARIYVRSDADELVVDVSGADPASAQSARVFVWDERQPLARASGSLGLLAETWSDSGETGASGEQFGSLATISASGSHVKAAVLNPHSVGVTFNPRSDGTFRVVVAAPHWPQSDSAIGGVLDALPADAAGNADQLQAGHVAWWHAYWDRVGLLRMSSADGSAEYRRTYARCICTRPPPKVVGCSQVPRAVSQICSASRSTTITTGVQPSTGCGTCACNRRRT